MEVIEGDLFEQDCNAICIPTNGALDKAQNAVMGAGVAKQAKARWPFLPSQIGNYIKAFGNNVWCITENSVEGARAVEKSGTVRGYHIVNFPTKPGRIYIAEHGWDAILPRYRKVGSDARVVPGWMGFANLEIIRHSAIELVELADEWKWKRVCLPKIGAGYGGLDWTKVREIISPILDDRFVICMYRPANPFSQIPQEEWEKLLRKLQGVDRDD